MALDSILWTISHIWTLRHHFDLSEVIFTIFTYHSILHRITLYTFPHLVFHSDCVPLCSQMLSLIHWPWHTVFYPIPSFFFDLARNFGRISLNFLICILDCTLGHIHTLTPLYPITFEQDITPLFPSIHLNTIGTDTRPATFRSFSYQCFYSVGCFSDHTAQLDVSPHNQANGQCDVFPKQVSPNPILTL